MTLGVLYEHPDWFNPLFATLERRGIPYERIDAASLAWSPAAAPSFGLLFNRMSPSAYLRGHGHAIRASAAYLDYVEAHGVPIVNGSAAYALEVSKSRQLDLLRRLALPHPGSRVVNDAARIPGAAAGMRFPIVVKPNVGGSGAKIQRFDTEASLASAVAEGRVDLGIDGIALVQEFLPARGGSITRVEVLEGRVLYAITLTPPAGHGFNLCPADICRTDAHCPAKPTMDIEAATISGDIARQVLSIASAAGLDICGIEFLVDDRDGQPSFYDINALSNFVTGAPDIVGFDPFERLVDYLEARMSARRANLAPEPFVGVASSHPEARKGPPYVEERR